MCRVCRTFSKRYTVMLWTDIPTTFRKPSEYLLPLDMVKANGLHTQQAYNILFQTIPQWNNNNNDDALLANVSLLHTKISPHADITVVKKIVWERCLLGSCWLGCGCCWFLGSRILSQREKTTYKIITYRVIPNNVQEKEWTPGLFYVLASRGCGTIEVFVKLC